MKTETRWVLQNPVNGLIWSRHNGHPVSEMSGDYTTYSSFAKASQAVRRSANLRGLYMPQPDPAKPWFVFGKPERFATKSEALAYAESLYGDFEVDYSTQSRGEENECN